MAPLARAAVDARKGRPEPGEIREGEGERERGEAGGERTARVGRYEHLRGGAAVVPSSHGRTMLRHQRTRSMRRELSGYFASSPLQKTLVSF